MTGTERRQQLIEIAGHCLLNAGTTARRSRRSRSAPTCPSPSCTSTSAARKGCTRSSSTGRCPALLDGDHVVVDNEPLPGARRAGGAGAAHLRRGADRRLPHPGPRFAGRHSSGRSQPAQRHRQPGRGHPRRRISRAAASMPSWPRSTRRRWSAWCRPPRSGGSTSASPKRKWSPRIWSTCVWNGLTHLEADPGLHRGVAGRVGGAGVAGGRLSYRPP